MGGINSRSWSGIAWVWILLFCAEWVHCIFGLSIVCVCVSAFGVGLKRLEADLKWLRGLVALGAAWEKHVARETT